MNKGKIVQVMGPVVDVEFDEKQELPSIKDALLVDNNGKTCVMEVSQHIGNHTVRCIMLSSSEGLHRDMEVTATGAGIQVPVGNKTLGRLFNVLGETIDGGEDLKNEPHWIIHRDPPSFEDQSPVVEVLETGIKVIDLLAPYAKGGKIGLFGGAGVGKTELSKALSEAMFGTEGSLIRVDMSEYMEKHSVSKMIGSPPGYVGYDEGGQLSEKVRRNPYSVILFDEIEKAHPDVFNILLQVLDDGHITDAQGRKIDFKNTVLIMTSNAGAENIISPKRLGFASASDEKENYRFMKERVMEEVKRLFKPEFLNRIDDIIVFHPLNRQHIKEIAEIMISVIGKRTMQQMNLNLVVDDKAKEFLIDKGYDEKYGARPLRRTIQSYIEDRLAEEILDGKVKSGDTVEVTEEDKMLKFSVMETINH